MKLSNPMFGTVLREATQTLAPSSPTPQLDAEVLLSHVCGVDRAGLIARAREALDADAAQRLQQLVVRRQRGEPIAYLSGTREFWSLSLAVGPAVLIPRPDTELLVERALARLPPDTDQRVVDLGTGSGAIALAIARERPRARVIATDVSTEALALARANADRLGIDNVEFRAGDWLAPLQHDACDMIVSNPPYLRSNDPHRQQGDLRFEPAAALDGGADGLDAIRRIAGTARARLRRGAWLLLEHGHDQAQEVADILNGAGFADLTCYRDLAGLPRVTEAR